MRRRVDKLRYLGSDILGYKGSIYKMAISDKAFQVRWALERRNRILMQGKCAYCFKKFKKDSGAVLHHAKMFVREQALLSRRVEIVIRVVNGEMERDEACAIYLGLIHELLNYYKTLKDTDLICSTCHAKEHSNIVGRRGKNRKLRF
jgi:hypothetical protein